MINYTNLTNSELYAQYANAAYLDLILTGSGVLLTFVLGGLLAYVAHYILIIEYREDWQEFTLILSTMFTVVFTALTLINGVSLAYSTSQYLSNKEAYVNTYIIKHMPSQNISLN